MIHLIILILSALLAGRTLSLALSMGEDMWYTFALAAVLAVLVLIEHIIDISRETLNRSRSTRR